MRILRVLPMVLSITVTLLAAVPASADTVYVFEGRSEYRDSGSTNSHKRSKLGAMDVRKSARQEQRESRRGRNARVREEAREERRETRRSRSARARDEAREERPGERRRNSRTSRRSTEVASLGDFGAAISNALHGMASFYWQPQRVASGGWFNPNAMTAAHKTLRFGTRVRVTHLGNGRSVMVTINDRGPYIKGRIIDLSKAAAGVIGMQGQGVARVRVDVVSSR